MRLSVLFFMLFAMQSFAQIPSGGRTGGGQQMNMGRLYGKIIDSKTGKPIDAASIQLTQNKFDSVSKTRKDVIINGQLTKANGEFNLEGLNVMVPYKLKITGIGYKTIEQKISFNLNMNGGDMSQMLNNIDKDLGNIKLEADVKELGEVVVTGERPTLQLGVDRKIFNVDRNIVSQGGTGVDVMRNVPTVSVDVDGNVTLRNNAPQIFVDGRPTTLTLEQIPADAIQSIELITNPSAKFDASGGQSAIINIVLKKNRRVGYSGGIRAGIDMRGRLNGGFDINLRQGKVNFFANIGFNQRKSIGWGETDRNNYFPSGKPSTVFQTNRNTNTGFFSFARAGFDFFINNRNTITISGTGGLGNFKGNDNSSFTTDSTFTSYTDIFEKRITNSINEFRNYGGQLSYKHNFTKAGREWTADLNYNKGKSDNDQDIDINTTINNGTVIVIPNLQTIEAGGNNTTYVAQTDFVNPITENTKMEMGLRTQIRTFESFQQNFLNNVFNPGISNKFKFTDIVNAAYISYSQKIKKLNLNYQLGLRAENSSYDGEQTDKNLLFKNQFPLSLFPSIFLSKTIKGKQDLQLNYTRRINRPSFFQLLPNTDFSDPLNYSTGNPNLVPEFTNSLELSYQKTYGKKNNTFLATLFGKYTTNLIARYIERKQVGNSDTLAPVSTWVNATNSYAAGLELVFKNTLAKWWEINYNANFYYSKINGTEQLPELENDRTSFFIKINNTFRVAKGWSIQLSGDYNSRSILPVSTGRGGGGGFGGFGGGRGGGFGGGPSTTTQGYIDANYYADLGVRKEFKIKTNTASISFNWSDFLRTRKNISFQESSEFDQLSWRRRDPQFFRLNFSYRFGKFDVSLFKRKSTRGDGDAMEGMQGQQ